MIEKIGSGMGNNTFRLTNNSNLNRNGASKTADNASLDKVAISSSSREIALLGALTSVNGISVANLKAVNNALNISANAYYRIKLPTGLNMVWGADVGMWETLKAESGLKTLEPETIGAYNDMNRFIAALSKGHGQTIREFVAEGKALGFYESLGIETGAWAEVNSPWRSGKFYIAEDGTPFSEDEIENVRMAYNTRDHRLEGCTEDSVLVINGHTYKMDENGHFNIPKGEAVIWHNNTIIEPKEMAEWRRAQSAQRIAEREKNAVDGGFDFIDHAGNGG